MSWYKTKEGFDTGSQSSFWDFIILLWLIPLIKVLFVIMISDSPVQERHLQTGASQWTGHQDGQGLKHMTKGKGRGLEFFQPGEDIAQGDLTATWNC